MKTFPFLAEWHTHGSVVLVAKAISTQFLSMACNMNTVFYQLQTHKHHRLTILAITNRTRNVHAKAFECSRLW
jgi:hypothetical protein